jgi:hypothetical protein
MKYTRPKVGLFIVFALLAMGGCAGASAGAGGVGVGVSYPSPSPSGSWGGSTVWVGGPVAAPAPYR